jgi:hypothetical protein
MNDKLREICDSMNTLEIERLKSSLTMDEIDAMTHYMSIKQLQIDATDFLDEEEMSILIYVKYISEYHIRNFILYLNYQTA